jgi:3-isopropylmalate/(R)-2-methylmalate dehydratase small subunit
MEVDLETQTVTLPNGRGWTFEIDPFVKHNILNGLDEIGLTMQHEAEIARFEEKRPSIKPSTSTLLG